METPFRWGILGPGRIADAFARGVGAVEGARIQAIATRDPARVQPFAQAYQIETVYDSYAALAQDPAIDAVYIATPHRFHFEQTLMCLEAGKPVLCEKPFTVNAREAAILIETARARGLFLMDALWTRHLPIYGKVRQWLDDGKIGPIKLISATFGFKTTADPADRLLNHDLAGGALLDLGVYCTALSQWAQQAEPVAISAHALIGPTQVDELTAVNLQYADGSVSQFTCTFAAQTSNDFHIYGSDGHIRIHPGFWAATRATLTTSAGEVTIDEPWRASGFEYQIAEAMRCIRAGLTESPVMTHAHSLATMRVLDRIRAQIGLRYTFETPEEASDAEPQ